MLGCLAGGSLPGISKLLGSSKLSGLLDLWWWVLVVLLDCRVLPRDCRVLRCLKGRSGRYPRAPVVLLWVPVVLRLAPVVRSQVSELLVRVLLGVLVVLVEALWALQVCRACRACTWGSRRLGLVRVLGSQLRRHRQQSRGMGTLALAAPSSRPRPLRAAILRF